MDIISWHSGMVIYCNNGQRVVDQMKTVRRQFSTKNEPKSMQTIKQPNMLNHLRWHQYVYYCNQAKTAWKAKPSPHSVQAASDCRFRQLPHLQKCLMICDHTLKRGFKHMHKVSPVLLALYKVQLCLSLNKCQKRYLLHLFCFS